MPAKGPFYSDGSRLDDGRAGAGTAVGDTRILARVSGEQESYRAEMFGLHLRSLCSYTQGRNISSFFFVNLDPCPR